MLRAFGVSSARSPSPSEPWRLGLGVSCAPHPSLSKHRARAKRNARREKRRGRKRGGPGRTTSEWKAHNFFLFLPSAAGNVSHSRSDHHRLPIARPTRKGSSAELAPFNPGYLSPANYHLLWRALRMKGRTHNRRRRSKGVDAQLLADSCKRGQRLDT